MLYVKIILSTYRFKIVNETFLFLPFINDDNSCRNSLSLTVQTTFRK